MNNLIHEPVWDLAHLAHIEMLTPKLEESTRFFTEIMGMSITATQGDSVYLRAYDDYEHHTLKLTASSQPGMRHYAWRTRSPQALARRVAAIEASGLGVGWNEGDLGHGPAYAFRSPDGHLTEIYFETEKYRSGPHDQSALKNTASKFPGRGINVRRIDHLNLFAADIRAFRDFQLEALGGILTETIVDNLDDMNPRAVWFMVNSKSYDLAVTLDYLGMKGRFHHVTYAVNSREEVLIAADICLENCCRHLLRKRYSHRNGTAQTHHPANVFPVRLRTRRQPRRNRQHHRPAHHRPRLPDGGLDDG